MRPARRRATAPVHLHRSSDTQHFYLQYALVLLVLVSSIGTTRGFQVSPHYFFPRTMGVLVRTKTTGGRMRIQRDPSSESQPSPSQELHEQPLDQGPSLGDIMARSSAASSELLTTSGCGSTNTTTTSTSLAKRYGITSPQDRILLTANGNLQRLVSSYYDAPVSVVLDQCQLVKHQTWDRRVHLTVHNQVSCSIHVLYICAIRPSHYQFYVL